MSPLRAEGVPLIRPDRSNPTTGGFDYPAGLLECLGDPRSLLYDPQPLGLASGARSGGRRLRDVAGCGRRRPRRHHGEQQRQLLAAVQAAVRSGDSVLVPAPSYPLFEHLAALDGIRSGRTGSSSTAAGHLTSTIWTALVDARTRAVLVVSPNNPTGSILTRAETRELHAFCAARDLALIGDEVFCDYPLDARPPRGASVLEERQALRSPWGGCRNRSACRS